MIKRFLQNYIFFKFLFWCWLVLLTLMLLMPGGEISKFSIFKYAHIDKVIHFVSMCISAILLLLGTSKPSNRKLNIIILLGYSVGVEFLQAAVSSARSFEWEDIAANVSGILVGWLTYFFLTKRFAT